MGLLWIFLVLVLSIPMTNLFWAMTGTGTWQLDPIAARRHLAVTHAGLAVLAVLMVVGWPLPPDMSEWESHVWIRYLIYGAIGGLWGIHLLMTPYYQLVYETKPLPRLDSGRLGPPDPASTFPFRAQLILSAMGLYAAIRSHGGSAIAIEYRWWIFSFGVGQLYWLLVTPRTHTLTRSTRILGVATLIICAVAFWI